MVTFYGKIRTHYLKNILVLRTEKGKCTIYTINNTIIGIWPENSLWNKEEWYRLIPIDKYQNILKETETW